MLRPAPRRINNDGQAQAATRKLTVLHRANGGPVGPCLSTPDGSEWSHFNMDTDVPCSGPQLRPRRARYALQESRARQESTRKYHTRREQSSSRSSCAANSAAGWQRCPAVGGGFQKSCTIRRCNRSQSRLPATTCRAGEIRSLSTSQTELASAPRDRLRPRTSCRYTHHYKDPTHSAKRADSAVGRHARSSRQ